MSATKIDGSKMKIDHLGIAVKSIAEARQFYESLGMAVAHEETVAHERVHTAMLPVGESRVELLEATDADSTVAKFIARRGEGLHHVALQVPDVDAAFAELQQRGVRLELVEAAHENASSSEAE